MAQFTGWRCDVCSTATEQRGEGWMHLTTLAQATGDKGWDICSNKCLIRLGRERQGDEPTGAASKRGRKSYTPDEKLEVIGYAIDNGTREASEKFGLHQVTVQNWVREFNKS